MSSGLRKRPDTAQYVGAPYYHLKARKPAARGRPQKVIPATILEIYHFGQSTIVIQQPPRNAGRARSLSADADQYPEIDSIKLPRRLMGTSHRRLRRSSEGRRPIPPAEKRGRRRALVLRDFVAPAKACSRSGSQLHSWWNRMATGCIPIDPKFRRN